MGSISQTQFRKHTDGNVSGSLHWLHGIGVKFVVFFLFGFAAILGILGLPASVRLGAWGDSIAIIAAPAIAVLLLFAIRQAWDGIKELRHKLVWWHGLWFLLFVSSLVFRIRDAAEAQALPIDGYATLRILPEFVTAAFLAFYFLRRRGALRQSMLKGLAACFSIYGLVCLLSAAWSVKPSWTMYKSCEFLLDLGVLSAVLVTVRSTEVYRDFFNWTLILCGLELLWTWMGAIMWPQEAFYSTYPPRLVGVFPIQSANAIGASGAVLSIVALCRLFPLGACRFSRAWNWVLCGFGVASMIACRTRAAMAGFAVALLLLFVLSRRARRIAVVSLLVMVSCYAGLLVFDRAPQPQTLWNRVAGPSGVVLNFMERGQNPEELESFTGRTEWWHLAWTQFLSRPLTGLGAYAGGKFGVLSKSGFGDTPQLHSDYLETLVGTSFWGLIPLLGSLFGTWWLLFRFVRDPRLAPFERQLAMEAIAILGVITVRSFFNVELIWHAPQFFLTVLGYAELLRRSRKSARVEALSMNPAPLHYAASQA